jgi:hypothetical protein
VCRYSWTLPRKGPSPSRASRTSAAASSRSSATTRPRPSLHVTSDPASRRAHKTEYPDHATSISTPTRHSFSRPRLPSFSLSRYLPSLRPFNLRFIFSRSRNPCPASPQKTYTPRTRSYGSTAALATTLITTATTSTIPTALAPRARTHAHAHTAHSPFPTTPQQQPQPTPAPAPSPCAAYVHFHLQVRITSGLRHSCANANHRLNDSSDSDPLFVHLCAAVLLLLRHGPACAIDRMCVPPRCAGSAEAQGGCLVDNVGMLGGCTCMRRKKEWY